MKNTMIFLHRKGISSNAPQCGLPGEIARAFDADLLRIKAPHPHKGDFRWHNGSKQPPEEALAEFEASVAHIESETKKILEERKISCEDIIWLGISQGGNMAIRQAMAHGAKRVVCIVPAIHDAFPLPANPRTDFPVDWVEAGKDEVLSPARRAGYKMLQNLGIEVNYVLSPDSTHNEVDLKPYWDSLKKKK